MKNLSGAIVAGMFVWAVGLGPAPLRAKETKETKKTELTVATFNIQQKTGAALEGVIAVMKVVDADIYGMQETDQGQGPMIAKALGFHHKQGHAGPGRSFISRYPIVEVSPSAYAAKIQVSDDQQVWIMNLHVGLHSNWKASYIPYAAAHGLSERQIIDNVLGLNNWAASFRKIEAEILPIIKNSQGIPFFCTGDFNEPSHLDWTSAQAKAGIIPTKVDAPLSHVMADGLRVDHLTDLVDQHKKIIRKDVSIDVDYKGFGFQDSYHVDRVQDKKNEVSRRGFTWTPSGGKSDDDRIDFVYYQGDNISVLDSQVFGEAGGTGVDLEFRNFPPDHRGVISRFSISKTSIPKTKPRGK